MEKMVRDGIPTLIVKRIDENLGLQDGARRLLGVWDTTLPPGTILQPHLHPDAEEVYYILEGRGRIMVGDETRTVTPGHLIYIPPGQPHTIHALGVQPLRWITVAIHIGAQPPQPPRRPDYIT